LGQPYGCRSMKGKRPTDPVEANITRSVVSLHPILSLRLYPTEWGLPGGLMQTKVVIALVSVISLFLIPAIGFCQVCGPGAGCGYSWPASGDVLFSTGYIGNQKGAVFTFTAANQANGSLNQIRQEVDLSGINLELSTRLRGSQRFGLNLGASYSWYFQTSGEETLQNVGAAPLSRNWVTQPQSGSIDGALTVRMGPTMTGLGGLRYENFMTNFNTPGSGFGAPLSRRDSAALTLNTWIPYLGISWANYLGKTGIACRFQALGSPLVWGLVDYVETSATGLTISGVRVPGFIGSNALVGGGYLMECVGDCHVVSYSCLQLGAYAKYQAMKTSTGVDTGQSNGNIPSVNFNFDFSKQVWSAGGYLSLVF
jgi:hypothetical protein